MSLMTKMLVVLLKRKAERCRGRGQEREYLLTMQKLREMTPRGMSDTR